MKTGRACLALAALALGVSQAAAADLSRGIAVAPVEDSLWLGRFSGGRTLAPGAEPIPFDWIDVKRNFTSLRDCSGWMRDMNRAYSTYEGWKTCLRIR